MELEEELRDVALVGSRWRLRSGHRLVIDEENEKFVVTSENTAVVTAVDDCNYATVVILSPKGKPLVVADGCIVKFLIECFEPVNLEECRSLAAAMDFYWSSAYYRPDDSSYA